MGFAKGLLIGVGQGATNILEKDLEQTMFMTKQLTSQRAGREEKNRLKYIKDRQEADENIQKAIGQIGDRGADVFQFLMDKHGYKGALEKLPQYVENAKYFSSDGSIATMLGLVERGTGKIPTLDYLSSMAVVKPPKAEALKTKPISFLDRVLGTTDETVASLTKYRLDRSGIPAIPEGMGETIETVGTTKPDFKLRDDYTLDAQQDSATTKLAAITEGLASGNYSPEARENLLRQQQTLKDQLFNIQRLKFQTTGSMKSLREQHSTLEFLISKTKDPEQKAKYEQQLQNVIEAEKDWVIKTATPSRVGTTISESALSRELTMGIKDVASKSGGFDPANPYKTIPIFNEETKKIDMKLGYEVQEIYDKNRIKYFDSVVKRYDNDPRLDVAGQNFIDSVKMRLMELRKKYSDRKKVSPKERIVLLKAELAKFEEIPEEKLTEIQKQSKKSLTNQLIQLESTKKKPVIKNKIENKGVVKLGEKPNETEEQFDAYFPDVGPDKLEKPSVGVLQSMKESIQGGGRRRGRGRPTPGIDNLIKLDENSDEGQKVLRKMKDIYRQLQDNTLSRREKNRIMNEFGISEEKDLHLFFKTFWEPFNFNFNFDVPIPAIKMSGRLGS